MNSEQPLAIGIDLGTTNSAISVWRDGKAELIPNALGEYLTPSVVSIDSENTVLVGRAAQSRLITYPAQTVAAFKRFMGSGKQYALSGERYTPTELSSQVLLSLKRDAQAFLECDVSEVVISVPAYFNDTQRKEVALAAELAGLNAVRLINEPTAAAMSYSLHDKSDRRFLVFDLGGGTFDVTIVEYQDEIVEVRASAGDNRLGGEDFTEALVRAVLLRLGKESDELDSQQQNALYMACEQAKCESRGGVSIVLPQLSEQSLIFSTTDLEKIWREPLQRLSKPLRQALSDARIQPRDIDQVIYVGGATRLSAVQQVATRLLERFGQNELNPDHVVALGAATQAACRLRDEAVEELILTDVCPFSLGVKSNRDNQHDVFSPIIERNTTVPVSKVERFHTGHAQQKQVNIEVYQGERYWAKDNIYIDRLEVEVPAGEAGEEAIDIRFSYDINGLLEVDVTVVSTGEKHQKVVDRTPAGTTEAERATSQQRLAKLKHHPRDEQANIVLSEFLHQLYEEKLGDERRQIEQLITSFEEALNSQNKTHIFEQRRDIQAVLKDYGY
ncbi:MAG: Hsp70 family protein [Pseudomonadales bacterium]